MTLPIVAPQIGSYGTGTLPIVFAAQSGVAGPYNVEASATGYQTQPAIPVSTDISLADAILNFILAP